MSAHHGLPAILICDAREARWQSGWLARVLARGRTAGELQPPFTTAVMRGMVGLVWDTLSLAAAKRRWRRNVNDKRADKPWKRTLAKFKKK